MTSPASLFITAAYHLGYDEFRGPQLLQPLIGNTILTVGYLVTGSVATPLIGHVIMHGAAVLHGTETTSQLPPHYGKTESGSQADSSAGPGSLIPRVEMGDTGQ